MHSILYRMADLGDGFGLFQDDDDDVNIVGCTLYVTHCVVRTASCVRREAKNRRPPNDCSMASRVEPLSSRAAAD